MGLHLKQSKFAISDWFAYLQLRSYCWCKSMHETHAKVYFGSQTDNVSGLSFLLNLDSLICDHSLAYTASTLRNTATWRKFKLANMQETLALARRCDSTVLVFSKASDGKLQEQVLSLFYQNIFRIIARQEGCMWARGSHMQTWWQTLTKWNTVYLGCNLKKMYSTFSLDV